MSDLKLKSTTASKMSINSGPLNDMKFGSISERKLVQMIESESTERAAAITKLQEELKQLTFDECLEYDFDFSNYTTPGIYKIAAEKFGYEFRGILIVDEDAAAISQPDGTLLYRKLTQTLIDNNGVGIRYLVTQDEQLKWTSWKYAFNEMSKLENSIASNSTIISETKSKVISLQFDVEVLNEQKADATLIMTYESSNYTFDFYKWHNCEMRLLISVVESISFNFGNGEYPADYVSGLSFDSGATPTSIDYTGSGILNWVGTDCATVDGLSVFQPSANTHYDIVFYFNGVQFIGLVNGFVPASGNEVTS